MIIYLASDHAGFELKEKIKEFLKENGYEFEDMGAFKLDSRDDYPDFIHKAAKAVSKCEQGSPSTGSRLHQGYGGQAGQKLCRGIIFGGSGQGEAMVANRYKSVRAAVYYGGSEKIIKLSREHNNANVLSLGARFVTDKEAIRAISLWLKTPFSRASRHARRIKKIDH